MPSKERIVSLDVIRGIAIIGIFLVNILWLSGVLLAPSSLHANSFLARFDNVTFFLINVFVENKFYAIFSMLFGAGFYLFLNSQSGSRSRHILFVRRLMVLFTIGCIHAFLLWNGDILLIYSILGFFLLWLNNQSNSIILTFIVSLFITSSVILPLLMMLLKYYEMFPDINTTSAAIQSIPGISAYKILAAFGQGTYFQILNTNATIWVWKMINYFYTGKLFDIFAYFSFGLYMSKVTFEKPLLPEGYIFFRSNVDFLFTCLFSLLVNFGGVILQYHLPTINFGLIDILNRLLVIVGAFSLAIIYMELGIKISRKKMFFATYLAAYGKTALTNYLFQTVISIFIFYSIGFGLYGKFSITACILLALLIALCQIFISIQWLKIFNYGPVEWLWRMLTYAEYIPLMKKTNNSNSGS